ncbi:MAG: FAD:protein FMN transferase [Actinomycetota bacterium]
MLVELHGTAMGTTVHLAATDVDDAHLDAIAAGILDRERRWTRFADDSELAALNRSDGRPCVVSADTAALIAAAVRGWHETGGRFDPSVHDAMVAAGYDRTFADGPGAGGPAEAAPGLDDIQVDPELGVVTVPAGVRLDLGGIGKGFAADLAVQELLAAGATQAAVSIGGDVSAHGHPERGWPIRSDHGDEPVAWLAEGGFCLSTTAKRRWSIDGGERHHILDPRTGRSAVGGIRDAAVAAVDATTAEVHATAAIVAGWPAAVDRLQAHGLDGFVVLDDGEIETFGSWAPNPSILPAAADRNRRE